MGKTGEAISHFNTTARTLILAVVVGGLGYGSFQAIQAYNAPRRELEGARRELDAALSSVEQLKTDVADRDEQIDGLEQQVADRDVQIDQLEVEVDRVNTAMRLLKLRRRIARIEVLDQSTADDGQMTTKIRFSEVGDENQTIGEPAEFVIDGDRVYVEYLVVKFDDRYVEQADLERGTAICVFERLFGENQEPGEGFVIDKVGSRPNAYARGSTTSEFEQQIWDDFWTIANDREKAEQLGIQATHAEAPSIRMIDGATYELDLRATGGLTLRRVE